MTFTGVPAYLGSPLTRDQIDNFIPNVWTGEILRYRDAQLHMDQSCHVKSFIGQKGDTLEIPLIGRAAIYDRIPGQPVQLQSRPPGKYEFKVDKDKESSHGEDDLVKLQSQYDTRTPITKESGYALARDIDNAILGLRAAVPAEQQIFVSSDGTVAGNAESLNQASILAAWQLMAEADVNLAECKWFFGINQLMDLLVVDNFISNDYNIAQLQAQNMSTGMVGTLYGIPVMVSTQIKNNSLDGYTNGEGAAPQPTPGVAGSPYLPTQESFTGLPRGTTGSELALPFMTGGLFHPDWAIVGKQQNITVEMSREAMLQMDVLITRHVYGAKTYRKQSAVLLHSLGTVI